MKVNKKPRKLFKKKKNGEGTSMFSQKFNIFKPRKRMIFKQYKEDEMVFSGRQRVNIYLSKYRVK